MSEFEDIPSGLTKVQELEWIAAQIESSWKVMVECTDQKEAELGAAHPDVIAARGEEAAIAASIAQNRTVIEQMRAPN